MQRTHYFSDDIYALLLEGESMAYMRFGSKPVSALLKRMLATGTRYGKHLRNYSHVRCEELEFFYHCKRGMNALDTQLFHDLLNGFGWREASWAVWLAALQPRAEWVDALREKRNRLPHAVKTIDLALLAAGQKVPEPMDDDLSALSDVRRMLEELPSSPYPMRLNISQARQVAYDAEVQDVRVAYHAGGVQSARHQARCGLVGYFGMTRSEWLMAGAGDPPDNEP